MALAGLAAAALANGLQGRVQIINLGLHSLSIGGKVRTFGV
jgi:hypothetical protein